MKKENVSVGLVALVALASMVLAKPQPAATQGQYLGVQSCSTSACHAKSTRPGAPAAYPSWQKDPHANAYAGGSTGKYGTVSGLSGQKAKDIAKKLSIADPTTSDACLKCHAGAASIAGVATKLALPAKGAASLEDGVQCESCHGPGAGYKDVHQKDDHKGAVAKGMYDLLAPGAAGKQCLACHGKAVVDAKLLGAGHPDQSKFNFGSYADSIKHWGGTFDASGNYTPAK
jgi:hypothetical protein